MFLYCMLFCIFYCTAYCAIWSYESWINSTTTQCEWALSRWTLWPRPACAVSWKRTWSDSSRSCRAVVVWSRSFALRLPASRSATARRKVNSISFDKRTRVCSQSTFRGFYTLPLHQTMLTEMRRRLCKQFFIFCMQSFARSSVLRVIMTGILELYVWLSECLSMGLKLTLHSTGHSSWKLEICLLTLDLGLDWLPMHSYWFTAKWPLFS